MSLPIAVTGPHAALRTSGTKPRTQKVQVHFKGHQHAFRITKSLSFQQLLEEAARHWHIEAEDYEFRDCDGVTWPGPAIVNDELTPEFDELADADQTPASALYLHSTSSFQSRPSSHRETPMFHPHLSPIPIPSNSASQNHFSGSATPPASPTHRTGVTFSQLRIQQLQIHQERSIAHSPKTKLTSCAENGELEAPTMSEQVQEVLLSNAPSLSAFCLNERVPDYNHSSEAAVDKHIAEQTLQAVAGGSKRGIKLVRVNDEVCISEVVEGSEIQISPTTHKLIRLVWETKPQRVLVVKKRDDPEIVEIVRKMATWLISEHKIRVMVEPHVKKELYDVELETFEDKDIPNLTKKLDLILCLGGDGTVLHANSLFQESTPPIMGFNLGSLGFLTPFRISNYKKSISGILQECYLTLRSRLFCVVVREVEGVETITKYTVLNEVVIDRGSSPYLSNLDVFCDDIHVTTVQADGLIVATTTGSTAYSLSAGGSMVHPQVPAILVTPICPHSLSFRPLLFPDAAELKIHIPADSRGTAWASFDGRSRTELKKGDYVIIKISKWPFAWINKSDTVQDWFKSLAECLHWNDRRKQKS